MESLGDNFFPLSSLNMASHSLPSAVADWKSVINLTVFTSYMENSFSLVTFKIFFLIFHTLTKICLRVDQFAFIFLEVNSASGSCFPSEF